MIQGAFPKKRGHDTNVVSFLQPQRIMFSLSVTLWLQICQRVSVGESLCVQIKAKMKKGINSNLYQNFIKLYYCSMITLDMCSQPEVEMWHEQDRKEECICCLYSLNVWSFFLLCEILYSCPLPAVENDWNEIIWECKYQSLLLLLTERFYGLISYGHRPGKFENHWLRTVFEVQYLH